MIRVTKDEWIPVDNLRLEEAAERAVKSTENLLVVAGPGAGKTELLAQRACYLFQTSLCSNQRKILALSFKTDAAQNLKDRIIKRCGKEVKDRIVSVTYDAFLKHLLDQFLYSLPEKLRPHKDYLVNDSEQVIKAFKAAGVVLPQKGEMKFCESRLLNCSINRDENLQMREVWHYLLKGSSSNSPCLTFKMINKLVIKLIETNPFIKKALLQTYQFVFLDEFQDTTSLQYEFIYKLFCDSQTVLTAVGDNKQRIMVWAGARKTIFRDFQIDFKAEIEYLVMNHRSAPRLIDLQKQMYHVLKEDNLEVVPSERWKPEDGSITLLMAEDEVSEAISVAEIISKQIKTGLKPNDICILCKQKPSFYTKYLIKELKNRGMRARIETDYQDLLKEPVINILLDIIHLSINRKLPKAWEDLSDYFEEFWKIDPDLLEMKTTDPYLKLDNFILNLKKKIDKVLDEEDLGELINSIILFLGVDSIKSTFPQYSQGNYLSLRLEQFKKLFWKEIDLSNKDYILALENFKGINSIPIMTIHKSKGLEYNSVFFIGLEDSAFWNFKKQPEEDRCAFFVALSRAKQNLLFSFCKYRSSDRYNSKQYHNNINEFFNLLLIPGMASIINV